MRAWLGVLVLSAVACGGSDDVSAEGDSGASVPVGGGGASGAGAAAGSGGGTAGKGGSAAAGTSGGAGFPGKAGSGGSGGSGGAAGKAGAGGAGKAGAGAAGAAGSGAAGAGGAGSAGTGGKAGAGGAVAGGGAGSAGKGGSVTGGSGGAAGSGGGPVPLGNPYYAISPDEASWGPEQAATLRALGAGMVRFQVCDWPASKAALATKIDVARAAGLHVYAELNYCTLPAYPDTTKWHEGYSDGGNAFNWAFAGAAGDVAASFVGKVDYYEIWNEPDAAPRPKEWDGSGALQYASPSTADWDGACGAYAYGTPYVPLGASWGLCPRQLGTITTNAYMAIKDKDPGAKVVAGNLLFHGEDAWVAKEYWKRVEESGAVVWYKTTKTQGKLPWDVVGIHPYGYRPTDGSLSAQLASFAAIASSYSDGAPNAISEYGWHTDPSGGDPFLRATEAEQADYVGKTFALGKQLGMPFVMWFNYLDAPGGSLQFGARKAVGSSPGAWKPSAKAYCAAASAPSCPAP